MPSGLDTESKLFENICKWVETQKKIEELKKENSDIQDKICEQLRKRDEEYQTLIFSDPYFIILCVMVSTLKETKRKSSS